jgi:integration host factor subunit alpha
MRLKTTRRNPAARQMTFLAKGFWCNVLPLMGATAGGFDVVETVSGLCVRGSILRRHESVLGGIMSEAKTDRVNGRTVTRADLSEVVYHRVGLSRTESAELVQAVLDEICDAAARGETVKLSSFGSFVVRSKGQRIGRNPKTGVEVPILPRRVMVFKPSNVLKARINGGSAARRGGAVAVD